MSAASHGATAGVVMGITGAFLAQQLGFLSFSQLIPALEYIAIGAVAGGVFGALVGWALGRRYLAKTRPGAESGF